MGTSSAEHGGSHASTICGRIRVCTHGAGYRELARMTGCNPETIRRNLLNETPTLSLVCALCAALDINANWLLFGLGPMHRRDLTANVVVSFGPETVRTFASEAGRAMARELQDPEPIDEPRQGRATPLRLRSPEAGAR